MRYEDERYVRLYVRDSMTWKMLPWQSKCLIGIVMRKLDRAGMIDLGGDGWAGLAALTDMPLELVDAGMPELLKRGVFSLSSTLLVMPNFLYAQECAQSDKARSAARRERARMDALGGDPEPPPPAGKDTTERHESCSDDTKRDDATRNVSESHAPSRDVTSGHAASLRTVPSVPCRAVPDHLAAGAAGLPGIEPPDYGRKNRSVRTRKAKKPTEPMPWTVANMLAELGESSGGRVIVDPFDDRLATPLTAVIRGLAKAGCDWPDVALVGHWIAVGGLSFMSDGVSLGWLAKVGNLADAIGKARRWDDEGRPRISADNDGKPANSSNLPHLQVWRKAAP